MKSMTGFGKAQATSQTVDLEVSIKSVNGRFLEVRLHAPKEYAFLESEFKKLLSSKIIRGTVDIYFQRHLTEQAQAKQVSLNEELAQGYMQALKDLRRALKLKGTPTLEMLARFPDLIKVEESASLQPSENKLALKVLSEALTACEVERNREGLSLQKELERLLLALEQSAKTFEQLSDEARLELEKRYRERLQKLGFAGQIDDQRLAQEIVIQSDRADINEEITRLREHIRAYRELLLAADSQGKKMDFYAQELLREVNTIGSKSQISKLTAAVVEAKTTVERIREQVQNVE
jgi:uncharacterized protein (TIGR00255 family)